MQGGTGRDLALGLATFAAFSPVLVDLFGSLSETDASWSILLAPLLIALCLLRGPQRPAAGGRGGLALLGLGLGLELVGVVSDAWSIARLGLPLAVLGLARLTGRPALPVALLSFGAVPPPTSILMLTSPWAESALGSLAATLAAAAGASVRASGTLLLAPEARLELAVNHSGLPLAVALAQLGWYAALRRGRGLRGAAASALAGGLLALPLQALGVLLAALALDAGWPGLGRSWLDWGLGACCALAVIAWVELRGPRRERGPG